MQVVSEFVERATDEQALAHGNTPSAIREKLSGVLTDMLDNCSDITGAMISSMDGRACAQRLRRDFDEHRLAAMSGALLALSDNLAHEAHEGKARNVLIESDEGHVFVMHAGHHLLLTVFTRPSSNFGMSLAHAKKASEEIASLSLGTDV